mmetsp:Transcript_447/g.1217  ORF Transcript_447/g.1217 Transcript_447/m.1217 type:complete len:255 (-) Transcript_447:308-1072(-)
MYTAGCTPSVSSARSLVPRRKVSRSSSGQIRPARRSPFSPTRRSPLPSLSSLSPLPSPARRSLLPAPAPPAKRPCLSRAPSPLSPWEWAGRRWPDDSDVRLRSRGVPPATEAASESESEEEDSDHASAPARSWPTCTMSFAALLCCSALPKLTSKAKAPRASLLCSPSPPARTPAPPGGGPRATTPVAWCGAEGPVEALTSTRPRSCSGEGSGPGSRPSLPGSSSDAPKTARSCSASTCCCLAEQCTSSERTTG